MKITRANYRKDRYYQRVVSAVNQILLDSPVVAPVEVFIRMDLLKREKLEDWRFTRVPHLEGVMNCNLSKANRILRILSLHAEDRGLKPSRTVYKKWGKGVKPVLWFSKYRHPHLEVAYSTHYVMSPSRRGGTAPGDGEQEAKQTIVKSILILCLVWFWPSPPPISPADGAQAHTASMFADSAPTQGRIALTERLGQVPAAAKPHPRTSEPIVIAHRGASGHRPEHTEAAYALAVDQGADFLEADVVLTRDGVLISRHENELSATTDVAARPEFAARRTTKTIDGVTVAGWFAEDFTLEEVKRLRAKERIPDVRPANRAFDGQYQVCTLAELIRLVKRESARAGRQIGLYIETKHPTYFAREGKYFDGTPIKTDLGALLIKTLVAESFADPGRVYIQSFEVQNLLELKRVIMPAARVHLPLVQLYGGLSGSSRPFDIIYNASNGADLGKTYPGLDAVVNLGVDTSYRALASAEALGWMARTYAAGIGPSKDTILMRRPSGKAAGEPTRDRPASQLTGEVHPLLARARSHGLEVHPYTLRAELPFRTLDEDGKPMTLVDEAILLLRLGATGLFVDQPELGVEARNRFLQ
jgi:glycerophosphoryl diester phosphodiesterase